MPSQRGKAANAGSTAQTKFTSMKPSLGINSRRWRWVRHITKAPQINVTAKDSNHTSWRRCSSPHHDHAQGTKNVTENTSTTRESAARTGMKLYMVQRVNQRTWLTLGTAFRHHARSAC